MAYVLPGSRSWSRQAASTPDRPAPTIRTSTCSAVVMKPAYPSAGPRRTGSGHLSGGEDPLQGNDLRRAEAALQWHHYRLAAHGHSHAVLRLGRARRGELPAPAGPPHRDRRGPGDAHVTDRAGREEVRQQRLPDLDRLDRR